MGKKGKFDKSCYIPNQTLYNRYTFVWGNLKAEREGVAENSKNQKKQAQKRR